MFVIFIYCRFFLVKYDSFSSTFNGIALLEHCKNLDEEEHRTIKFDVMYTYRRLWSDAYANYVMDTVIAMYRTAPGNNDFIHFECFISALAASIDHFNGVIRYDLDAYFQGLHESLIPDNATDLLVALARNPSNLKNTKSWSRALKRVFTEMEWSSFDPLSAHMAIDMIVSCNRSIIPKLFLLLQDVLGDCIDRNYLTLILLFYDKRSQAPTLTFNIAMYQKMIPIKEETELDEEDYDTQCNGALVTFLLLHECPQLFDNKTQVIEQWYLHCHALSPIPIPYFLALVHCFYWHPTLVTLHFETVLVDFVLDAPRGAEYAASLAVYNVYARCGQQEWNTKLAKLHTKHKIVQLLTSVSLFYDLSLQKRHFHDVVII